MTVALVIRLLPDHLAEGEVAGWVEVPRTGERHPVSTGEELLQLLLELGATSGDGGRTWAID